MIATVLAVYGGVALVGTVWLAAFAWRRNQLRRPQWTRFDQDVLDQIHRGD